MRPGVATPGLLAAAGVDGIVVPEEGSAPPAGALRQARAAELAGLVPAGLWPGIRRGPSQRARDVEVASASREPWVDANSYLVAFERAIRGADILLGFEANEKSGVKPDVETPLDIPELALIEARIMGGNWIVDLPARHRERLQAGDPKMTAAWNRLGQTAKWLKENRRWLGLPVLPIITALVEPGGMSREIVNLLFRRGASPRVESAAAYSPSPTVQVLVAAGLRQAPPAAWAFAERGGTVVTDSPAPPSAKLLREEPDRKFLQLGSGTLVTYNKRIADPSEFALDVIDILKHPRRATRLWNARAAVPVAMQGPTAREAVLAIVNYSSPAQEEIQARIQGRFSQALLLQPGKPDKSLKVALRGSTTEVFLPELERLALIRFTA